MINSNTFLTQEERADLMQEIDPGDRHAVVCNDMGNDFVNQHNREACNFAVNGFYAIKQSYKHDIERCCQNNDFTRLTELIHEVNNIIISDPYAWGQYLPRKFFKWISEATAASNQ